MRPQPTGHHLDAAPSQHVDPGTGIGVDQHGGSDDFSSGTRLVRFTLVLSSVMAWLVVRAHRTSGPLPWSRPGRMLINPRCQVSW
jgi:hypothetical protein